MSRRKRRTTRTKKLTKPDSEDTNKFVGDSLKHPDDAGWDDVDQAFFASAPPEVPELPQEAERFDDLFPAAVAAAPEKHERPAALRRASAAAISTRASLQRGWSRVRPAIASTGRQAARLTRAVWQRSARASAWVGTAGRAVRPAVGRLVGVLRLRRLNPQTVALAVACVILISGVSAVVVASRSGAHASLPPTPLEPRASAAGTTVASVAPVASQPFPAESELATAPNMQSSPAEPEPEPVAAAAPLPEPEPAHTRASNESRHRLRLPRPRRRRRPRTSIARPATRPSAI